MEITIIDDIFTIEINPLKFGFVKEQSTFRPSPVKAREGYKYVYKWSDKRGRPMGFMQQTEACKAEEARLTPPVLNHALRALTKAQQRFDKMYEGIRYEDEIVGVEIPYPQIPTATRSIMSKRWKNYKRDKKILKQAKQKLKGKIHGVIKSYQDKDYKIAKGCLFDLNMCYLDLCRVARPSNHEVVFKDHENFILSFRAKKKKKK